MPNDLEYVVKDALMMCDKGAAPAPFNPTFNTHIKVSKCLVSTKADKIPMTNIPPFGACSAKSGNPCAPAPIEWMDTYKVKVKGQETILFKSNIQCSAGGGKITFITSGQVPIPPDELDALMEEHGEKEKSGWGFWDFVELVPVIGSVVGIVREAAKGNWGKVALNVGFLVMDVAGLVSFGATTVAATAAKTSIKVGVKAAAKSAAKAATKSGIKAAGKTATKAFGKAVAKAADKIAAAKGIVCVTACFPKGTLIHTDRGQRNIEDIKVGDKVWAFNEETEVSALKKVLNTIESEVDATVELTLDNEKIETTAEHPFYTKDGWKVAADLTDKDKVRTKEEQWHQVKEARFLYKNTKVYNFEVQEWASYFVGSLGWLVHNARPCLSKIKHLPDWIASMWKGQYFDFIRNAYYKRIGGFTEVVLDAGKRLDAYIPGKEIISRKFTQLSRITAKTAKGYIDEFVEKYAPGTLIKGTARNADAIAKGGQELAGKMFLEVPEQVGKITDEILEYATKKEVYIRDIAGNILNKF